VGARCSLRYPPTMRRRSLGAGLAIALVAGLAVAFLVQRSRPRIPAPPPSAEAPADERRAPARLDAGVDVPGGADPDAAGAPDAPDAAAGEQASSAAPDTAEAASAPSEASELIPLEKLLTWEPSAPGDGIDLSAVQDDEPVQSDPALRLGVERGDPAPPLGSRRGTRTEIDLSVPVGDAEDLRLRGGIRVDGEEGGRGAERRETRPTLGIEKRF